MDITNTITSDDIIDIFRELKTFLVHQVDSRLYYMINEFRCLSYRMEIRQQENKILFQIRIMRNNNINTIC